MADLITGSDREQPDGMKPSPAAKSCALPLMVGRVEREQESRGEKGKNEMSWDTELRG